MDVLNQWSTRIFYDAADKRTRDWPLLGSAFSVTLLTIVWLWFVLHGGPRFMRNRKPMKLTNVLHVINIVQIFANVYVTYEFLAAGWFNGYNFQCQVCEHTLEPGPMRMAIASYIYYLLKIFDLSDTVLYVLRRKQNQITFLHVYHHVSILIIGWMIANYAPGGHVTFSMMLNTVVHVIMYTYYFLASLGPQYQPYLWWKKYLTLIQLVQFVIQFWHNANALYIGCEYPNFILYYFLPTITLIFALFINFYIKSYGKKPSKKQE